ncbi:hypothetical protein VOLCADRAFT_99425 [Volvox carteri f. nagariensis]|uniref:Uncharacterized protein n=1 Tax=Volvox carteri f. nagariensis TaxID=3068 RepID=D8UHS2_VOLCA|nr:uncharacterized protein VOLCADRAFT_99425 [Volvox carteri f. nagariensis]EFJ40732.1 hypothetical protein VOLCADRAFT_99425 [Volvox carteri f. nagariensis]|eukprot:XP_002958198.1 hypothetical protein VOLCADRAFT_99425 [Volvox carteri f. nagariensis]
MCRTGEESESELSEEELDEKTAGGSGKQRSVQQHHKHPSGNRPVVMEQSARGQPAKRVKASTSAPELVDTGAYGLCVEGAKTPSRGRSRGRGSQEQGKGLGAKPPRGRGRGRG